MSIVVKMSRYNYDNMEINGVEINNKIFEDEKSDYILIERSEQIDNLISWISECSYDREGDKALMKEDLKYLMTLDDEYIFSSIYTNEYIAYSDDPTRFYDICRDLLEQSGLTREEVEELLLDDKRDETRLTLLGHEIKIVPSIDKLRSVCYGDVIECINTSILNGNDGGTVSSFGVMYEWSFFSGEQNVLYGSFYLDNNCLERVVAYTSREDAEKDAVVTANKYSELKIESFNELKKHKLLSKFFVQKIDVKEDL